MSDMTTPAVPASGAPGTGGAMGDGALGAANPVTGDTFGGTDSLGAGNSNTGDAHTATIPTGTHGGGMGSGAGLDADDLADTTDGVPETNKSASSDGAGTGNYANTPDSGTDDEQTGVVGEVNGDDKAAGGI